jgi:hypothetical protein
MKTMKTTLNMRSKAMLLVAVIAMMTVSSSRLHADTGSCGGQTTTLPFTDVPASNIFFCSIAEAYFSALTNGTSPTTYSPTDIVPRQQMAAFIIRTMDQSSRRASERAMLDQWWTPQSENSLGLTAVGTSPNLVTCDGSDLWVATSDDTVVRVRASDGSALGTWTGATGAFGVVAARGKIFITGLTTPGSLYEIDPTQAPGIVATLSNGLGGAPFEIAYDGARLWTANGLGSINIITLTPFSVSLVAQGFNTPLGILFDGNNIWVADVGDNSLKKLDGNGAILQSIGVGDGPSHPTFDGTNIWVPCQSSDTITVVRVKDSQGYPLANPFVVATLSGNGMSGPLAAAFDGERILTTNSSGDSVSLWRAADLTPIGSCSTGNSTSPTGTSSNGLNFWIALNTNPGALARF